MKNDGAIQERQDPDFDGADIQRHELATNEDMAIVMDSIQQELSGLKNDWHSIKILLMIVAILVVLVSLTYLLYG